MGPRGVSPGMFDLHDLGPEVPEHRRGERSGEQRRRVYDLDPLERLPLRPNAPLLPWTSNPALHLCPCAAAPQGFDRAARACYVGVTRSTGEGVSDGPVRYRRAGRARCSAGPGPGSGGHRDQGRAHLGGGGGVLIRRRRRSHRRRGKARAPRRGRRPLPPRHLPRHHRGYEERDALVARGRCDERHQLLQDGEPLPRKERAVRGDLPRGPRGYGRALPRGLRLPPGADGEGAGRRDRTPRRRRGRHLLQVLHVLQGPRPLRRLERRQGLHDERELRPGAPLRDHGAGGASSRRARRTRGSRSRSTASSRS